VTDIFISYASEDRGRAESLARAFEARGWSVWWDRRILTGQTYDQVIERALGGARCVVVLWSQHSVASEWVKNEATVALERGMLVPATIEDVQIPLEFRRRQTADLSDWDENASHPAFEALCDGISAALAAASSAGPAIAHAHERGSTVRSGSRPTRGWVPAAAIVAVLALIGAAYYAGTRRASSSPSAPETSTGPAGAPSAQEPASGADPTRSSAPEQERPNSPSPAASSSPGEASAVDLLSAQNGGQLLLAPNNEWAAVVDGKVDVNQSVRVGEAAVFAFKGDRPATFDRFAMLIPRSGRNPKEFELLAGDESPTGAFRTIGTFNPQDARVFKTNGWQEFTFPPVTARYLKVRLRANYEDTVWIELYEFKLTGRLSNAG
jgi:hypothetical protein